MRPVSVVIPTLNEKENLPVCLENLTVQTGEGDEVIIVDGGSDDGTIDIALDHGADVYVSEESSIGLARHIGVTQASNPVIATTDADAIPPEGWLDRIKENFKDDDLTVLWGTIEDKNGVPIRNLVGKFSTLTGGASGNNTAYRRDDYMEMENIYPDISFMEDAIVIYRLALHGKAVRDKNLVMVMNMERERYQTKPIVGIGTGLAALGTLKGGNVGKISRGVGAGMIGTELTYENATGTPFHHDQVGAGVMEAGRRLGNGHFVGTGIGMIAHHGMTEGISALPTALQAGTDVVID